MITSTTHTDLLRDDLPVTFTEAGDGRPALILHGGGGPFTVAPIADHLSVSMRTITPLHPGWDGTERPGWLDGVDDLAVAYLHHLEDSGLRDVLVIGSSLGGWIGSEIAARDDAGIVSALIVIDGTGVEIEGEPMPDFFALDARGVAEHSFHDPDRFFRDPATVSPEQAEAQRRNMATMTVLAGEPYMHDPTLLGRLGGVGLPVLAIWGESDRIVTPAYGAGFAAAFPDSRFEIVERAGHLPQLEQPAATFALIDGFIAAGR